MLTHNYIQSFLRMQEAMEPLRGFQRHFDSIERMRPVLQAAERLQLALEPTRTLASQLTFPKLDLALQSAQRLQTQFTLMVQQQSFLQGLDAIWKTSQFVQSVRGPLSELLQQHAALTYERDLMEGAEWVPHRTTPFHLIKECEEDPERLRKLIEEHYRSSWPTVKELLRVQIETYLIDDDARSIYLEALNAHESGFYTCVTRVLFPTIESTLRAAFNKGPLGRAVTKEVLQKLGDELPVYELRGHFGVSVYEYVVEHLFGSVRDDTFPRFADSSVPNRHASIHGLVVYNSFQSSMNALLLCDYVFLTVDALRRAETKEQE